MPSANTEKLWERINSVDKQAGIMDHRIEDLEKDVLTLEKRQSNLFDQNRLLENKINDIAEGKNSKFEANQAAKNRRHNLLIAMVGTSSAFVSAILVYFATTIR